MSSEIQQHADFTQVRYANCWEDADILIKALEPDGRHCLSIGSAGDNAFALLAAGAESVVVSEMNPAQVACIQLRKAAYQALTHEQFLTLLGETGSSNERSDLYQLCVPFLPPKAKVYWDYYSDQIQQGFGRIGKFESYFKLFREKVLPLVHGSKMVSSLLTPRSAAERDVFYNTRWDTWRWRLLFKCFFSRFAMGRLGRDPAFFKYVEGSVADRILERTKHALVALPPHSNPYLRWILNGHYGTDLPFALRPQHFKKISENLDKIHISELPLESVLESGSSRFDAFNLSDIFEYMSAENTQTLLEQIHQHSSTGARLAYWNMLAPRSRPNSMAHQLKTLDALGANLLEEDKAFFYSKFIVEEVI
ncbi:MAG: S-adenosylmethionine-diacylglycerol 3-amino-3-carboxypropyl transferase [Crocinitomicaceae bacterium]|jgi:S-adenosylmethionine-diacylglycerol 3-amino-3-carboxypropyl transferase